MEIIGVRVTRPDGTLKDYPGGRGFRFDGYADLQIIGEDDAIVALRKRDSVEEAEVLYADTPEPPTN